jgi:hypothetical protein
MGAKLGRTDNETPVVGELVEQSIWHAPLRRKVIAQRFRVCVNAQFRFRRWGRTRGNRARRAEVKLAQDGAKRSGVNP